MTGHQPAAELLQTKLFRPPLRPLQIPRPQLYTKLNAGLAGKLTLISAPAGFGKTATTVGWLTQLPAAGYPYTPSTTTWLTLDEGDNDPARFLAYMVAALQRLDERFGQNLVPLKTATLEPAIIALINSITAVSVPILFVLEDFHHLQLPQIHEAMAFLLEHQPPAMHIVLTSREDPPLPLARLRVQGQLTEIRQQDLRFSAAETTLFLNEKMQLDLPAALVTALNGRTEGWVAGLQLAALAIKTPPGRPERADLAQFITDFSGSNRYVIDYLVEEVLQLQPGPIRQFLQTTAVLDRFCAELCDWLAAAEPGTSKTILGQLETANLFLIPLDDQRHWFRYHHLFADFLRTEVPAARQQALHKRAAAWFKANHYLPEAITQALAGADFEEAGALIAGVAQTHLASGEIVTLLGWLAQLPADIVHDDPALAAVQGWLFWLSGQGVLAAQIVQQVYEQQITAAPSAALLALETCLMLTNEEPQQAIQQANLALAALAADDHFYRNMVLLVMAEAQNVVGDIDGAIRTLAETVTLAQQAGDWFTAVGAAMNQAQLYINQARNQEAHALCDSIITQYGATLPPPITGLVQITQGELAYQANELQAAESLIRQGMLLSEPYDVMGVAISGKLALLRVYQVLEREAEALALAQEVRQRVEAAGFEKYVPLVTAVVVELQIWQGQLAAAAAWVEQCDLRPADGPDLRKEVNFLVYARYLLAVHQAAQALKILEHLLALVAQNGRKLVFISAKVLQARGLSALERHTRAESALRAAVQVAAPALIRRPFVDDGPSIKGLLTAVRATAPDFIDSILAALPVAERQGERVLPEPLSARELEVLTCVAQGRSNRQAAAELFVTEGTIKKHLNNIYGKLGVKNRTQAINRARHLHLIS